MDLHLRHAILDDAAFLFALRTDPDVTAASSGPPPTDLATHRRWLERSLQSPTRRIYVVENDGEPIGQCRLDLMDIRDHAEVSIALIRSARGQGVGTEVLRALAILAQIDGIRWLEAIIKETNIASRKAFLKAGYSVEESKDGLFYMAKRCA